jgi:diguanylate cyclase (GGDEF)-like protein
LKILIAEDDPVSAHVLAVTLAKWGHEVTVTRDGIEAWEKLHGDNAPMLAILDWMMPGIDGLEICRRVRREITDSPIYLILLTAMRRREDLIEGLEAGADDYLTKPFDRHELRLRLQVGARIVELQQSLRERVQDLEQAKEGLRNLTLTDHMTGLYNHRGFYTLARHNAKLAKRSGQPSALIFTDMDGLKQINDQLGHAQGSLAITKTAELLRQTFRDCDLIARLGGDEFVVLAPCVPPGEMMEMIQRLRDNVQSCNENDILGFPLSLSIGAVTVDHKSDQTLEEYVTLADHAMYQEKRQKSAYRLALDGSVNSEQTQLAPESPTVEKRAS